MKVSDLFEARGEYGSFKSWKAAVKKKHPEAWIEGDEDIAQAMVGPKPYKRGETKSVGEWDGAKGELFESQAARNAAEAGRGQSARDFKKMSYSDATYWKDDAKDKGYTIKKVSGSLMKGDQTWHAYKGDNKVGEFTEKEEGRGGWLTEGKKSLRMVMASQRALEKKADAWFSENYKDHYLPLTVKGNCFATDVSNDNWDSQKHVCICIDGDVIKKISLADFKARH